MGMGNSILMLVRHISGQARAAADWSPQWHASTAGDNDVSIQLPWGEEWHVLFVWVIVTTSGTAGDRQIVLEFRTRSNEVRGQIRVGATQAASLTRYYMFAPALADMGAFRDTDYLTTPLPVGTILPERSILRVYDNNGVSANDAITVRVLAAKRPVGAAS